jgi:hypothetical protein
MVAIAFLQVSHLPVVVVLVEMGMEPLEVLEAVPVAQQVLEEAEQQTKVSMVVVVFPLSIAVVVEVLVLLVVMVFQVLESEAMVELDSPLT